MCAGCGAVDRSSPASSRSCDSFESTLSGVFCLLPHDVFFAWGKGIARAVDDPDATAASQQKRLWCLGTWGMVVWRLFRKRCSKKVILGKKTMRSGIEYGIRFAERQSGCVWTGMKLTGMLCQGERTVFEKRTKGTGEGVSKTKDRFQRKGLACFPWGGFCLRSNQTTGERAAGGVVASHHKHVDRATRLAMCPSIAAARVCVCVCQGPVFRRFLFLFLFYFMGRMSCIWRVKQR